MNAKPHRILLVDDDLDQRFITSRLLKKAMALGASINVACGGKEAISYMIGEGKFSDRTTYPFPTIVISDLNMPDGDGFDLLEFMANNPGWSVVPRIMYSSSEDPDDIRTAYQLGVSAYHIKAGDLAVAEKLLRGILVYWATTQVPPVDEQGRLLATSRKGRRGARYRQVFAGKKMERPAGSASSESLS